MSFVKHYVMTSRPDGAEDLQQALNELRNAVEQFPGSLGVDLLQDLDQPERFVFIERWDDQASHASAGKQLPGEIMSAIKAALGSAPQSMGLALLER